MAEKRPFEFRVLQFVPNVVQGMGANVGVVLVEVGGGFADVRLTEDWRAARVLDANFDVEVISAMADALRERLRSRETDASRGGEAVSQRDWALYVMEDWLSNAIQVSAPRALMTNDPAKEIEGLVKMYCTLPVQHREAADVGRSGILRRMRDEFQQAGVWGVMNKEIEVHQYTRHGDPLKIDCGYRYPREYMPDLVREEQKFRMFHAVSLKNDVNAAKVLAFTFGDFREGLEKEVRAKAELTAIVEDGVDRGEESAGFAMETMERYGIAVAQVKQVPEFAQRARIELLA